MKYLWALALSAIAVTAAPVSYNVSVDLSSVTPVTSGFIDLQFLQSGGAPSGTAVVSLLLLNDLTIDESGTPGLGAVSGNLVPGPLTFLNTLGFNSYFFGIAVTGPAANIVFNVTLSGDILDAPNGSGTTFSVQALAADQATSLVTGGPVMASIEVDGLGALTTFALGGSSVSAVPEPGFGLAAGALCLALGLYRRQRA
jgi:hypothetical protein